MTKSITRVTSAVSELLMTDNIEDIQTLLIFRTGWGKKTRYCTVNTHKNLVNSYPKFQESRLIYFDKYS